MLTDPVNQAMTSDHLLLAKNCLNKPVYNMSNWRELVPGFEPGFLAPGTSRGRNAGTCAADHPDIELRPVKASWWNHGSHLRSLDFVLRCPQT